VLASSRANSSDELRYGWEQCRARFLASNQAYRAEVEALRRGWAAADAEGAGQARRAAFFEQGWQGERDDHIALRGEFAALREKLVQAYQERVREKTARESADEEHRVELADKANDAEFYRKGWQSERDDFIELREKLIDATQQREACANPRWSHGQNS
jgi:hypothetical protein